MKEGAITERIMELAEKWLDGSITEQEKAEFTQWYNQFNDGTTTVPVSPAVLQRDMLKAIMARVHAEKQQQPPMVTRPVRQWMRYAAVAAGLFLASWAGYFLLHKKDTGLPAHLVNKTQSIQDIPPGKKKAVLTLANGSKVILDSVNNGLLAQQGSTNIMKTANGRLVYTKADEKPGNPLTIDHSPPDSYRETYNILTTPRGGQYQLVLPDGSKVWLNAASSIRYPTAFTGSERKVEITGEAYFEINKVLDSRGYKIPFVVNISSPTGGGREGAGGRVEVLGTHFNINAYDDEEAMKTTLLEGRVKVSSRVNSEWSIIKPGEQAVLSAHSPLAIDHSPDLQQVMAWKNGLFQFHNAGLPGVLRQISRWYDVDIRYEGDMPMREFEGKIQRNLTLQQVLKILEKNQVHLVLEGRTIIVKNTKYNQL